MKRKRLNRVWNKTMAGVLTTSFGIGFYFIAALCPLYLLISFGEELGGWLYMLLLFLYFIMLAVAGAVLYRRNELRRERVLLGDEAFFEMYPRLWRRELRRRRKLSSCRPPNV